MSFWDSLSRFAGNLTGGFIGESDEERKRKLAKTRSERETSYVPKNTNSNDFNTNYRSNVNNLLKNRYSYDQIAQKTGLDREVVSDYGSNILGKYWDEQEEIAQEQIQSALGQDAETKAQYDEYINADALGQRKIRSELEKQIASFRGGSEEDIEKVNKARLLENAIYGDNDDEKSNLLTTAMDFGGGMLDMVKQPIETVGHAAEGIYDTKRLNSEATALNDLYHQGKIDFRTLKSAYESVAGKNMTWQNGLKVDEEKGITNASNLESMGSFSGGIFETGSNIATIVLPRLGVTVDIPAAITKLKIGSTVYKLPASFTKQVLANYAKSKLVEGSLYTAADTLGYALQGEPITVQSVVQNFAANTLLDAGFDSLFRIVSGIRGKEGRLLTSEEVRLLPKDVQIKYLDSIAAKLEAKAKADLADKTRDLADKTRVDEKMKTPDESIKVDGFNELAEFIDDFNDVTVKVDKTTGEMTKKTPAEVYLDYKLMKDASASRKITDTEKAAIKSLENYLSGFDETKGAIVTGDVDGNLRAQVEKIIKEKTADAKSGTIETPEVKSELQGQVADKALNKEMATPERVVADKAVAGGAPEVEAANKPKGNIDPAEVEARMRQKSEGTVILDENDVRHRQGTLDESLKADLETTKKVDSRRGKIAEAIKGKSNAQIVEAIAKQYGLNRDVVAALLKKMDGNAVGLIEVISDNGEKLKSPDIKSKNAYLTGIVNKKIADAKVSRVATEGINAADVKKMNTDVREPAGEGKAKFDEAKAKTAADTKAKAEANAGTKPDSRPIVIEEINPNGSRTGDSQQVTFPTDENISNYRSKKIEYNNKNMGYASKKSDIVITDANGNELRRIPYDKAVKKWGTENRTILANKLVNGDISTPKVTTTEVKAKAEVGTKPDAKAPKNGPEIVKKLQSQEPKAKATPDDVSKSFENSRKSVRDYSKDVVDKIDKEYGWDKFYEEVYFAEHPDKAKQKNMTKKGQELYNAYLKPLNDYLAKTSGTDMGYKKYYIPQMGPEANVKTSVYGKSMIEEMDLEFGSSKTRQYKMDYNDLDKSSRVFERYFDQQFTNRYKSEIDAGKSAKASAEITNTKIKEFEATNGRKVTDTEKAKITEEVRQSPDGARSADFYRRMDAVKKRLIDKTKKAVDTDTPVGDADINTKQKTIDQLSEEGRREKLKQTKITNRIGKVQDMVGSADDIFTNEMINGVSADTMFGFRRYRTAGAVSNPVMRKILNIETPENVKHGRSLRKEILHTKITDLKPSKLVDQLTKHFAETKTSLGEKQLAQIVDNITNEVFDTYRLFDKAAEANIKLDDAHKIAMLKDVFSNGERVVARQEFIEAGMRSTFTNRQFKNLVNYHGERMILKDNAIKSICEKAADGIGGQVSAGLLGLKIKSALFNILEPKRVYAEFGIAKTGRAIIDAFKEGQAILNEFDVHKTKFGDVTANSFEVTKKMTKEMKSAFTEEVHKSMGQLFTDGLSKVNKGAKDIAMFAFKSTEELKDAIFLAAYKREGISKGLSGQKLVEFVMSNYEKMAIKQGQFGALGVSRNWATRLLTQFSGYPIKEFRITGRKVREVLGSPLKYTMAERVAAAKYLARWTASNTAVYFGINLAFQTSFENVFGLQVPAGGPLVSVARYTIDYLSEKNANEQAQAEAEASGEEFTPTNYAQSKLTKSIAMLIPGGDQLLNKTGVQGLIEEDSKFGEIMRNFFPDGYIKTMKEGFDKNSSGKIRFEMDQNPSAGEWLAGILDGEYNTKNAKEYFGNIDVRSGIPIIGRYYQGEKGYPAWKSVNEEIDAAGTMEEKQAIFNKWKDRVKEDSKLEKAFLEMNDDATVASYFKLNGKTLVENKSQLERLAEKVGLGSIGKEIDALFNGPQTSYYTTKLDDKGVKEYSWITPEKYEFMKDEGVYNKEKQDAELRAKRDGAPIDPIFTLSDKKQVNQLLEMRSMASGDDKELDDILEATQGWYRKYKDDLSKYYEANTAFYADKDIPNRESARVKEYRELSMNYVKPPTHIEEYYKIKEEQGEGAAKTYSKNNRSILNGEWDAYNKARLKRVNAMRAIEGHPPMTLDVFTNSSYGFDSTADDYKSYYSNDYEYHPYTGVANTIGRLRPTSGEGISRDYKNSKALVDPTKAFKKVRAKQTSPIRIKI